MQITQSTTQAWNQEPRSLTHPVRSRRHPRLALQNSILLWMNLCDFRQNASSTSNPLGGCFSGLVHAACLGRVAHSVSVDKIPVRGPAALEARFDSNLCEVPFITTDHVDQKLLTIAMLSFTSNSNHFLANSKQQFHLETKTSHSYQCRFNGL